MWKLITVFTIILEFTLLDARWIYYQEECLAYNLENQDRYICDPDGNIICLEGWEGEKCTEPVCTDCGEHGTCVSAETCRCDMGYYGTSCQHCIKRPGCKHG